MAAIAVADLGGCRWRTLGSGPDDSIRIGIPIASSRVFQGNPSAPPPSPSLPPAEFDMKLRPQEVLANVSVSYELLP